MEMRWHVESWRSTNSGTEVLRSHRRSFAFEKANVTKFDLMVTTFEVAIKDMSVLADSVEGTCS